MALGRLGAPEDGQCVMLECADAEGRLRALLSFVPCGPHGLSLDLMRRDRDSENGLVEFMAIELLRRGREHIAVIAAVPALCGLSALRRHRRPDGPVSPGSGLPPIQS